MAINEKNCGMYAEICVFIFCIFVVSGSIWVYNER